MDVMLSHWGYGTSISQDCSTFTARVQQCWTLDHDASHHHKLQHHTALLRISHVKNVHFFKGCAQGLFKLVS